MEEFGCSKEVAILGLSMFVIGLAIGPMVVSPLSEVCLVCPSWLLPKSLQFSQRFTGVDTSI